MILIVLKDITVKAAQRAANKSYPIFVPNVIRNTFKYQIEREIWIIISGITGDLNKLC